MKIYNTLTRSIEEFKPIEEGKVKMYTCGPTVYHYAHIGNIRNYIGHDILYRILKYLGYEVTRAMNITDVGHLSGDSDQGEDKMEIAKKREGKTSMEIAKFYTDAFFKDYSKVNCIMPEIVSSATNNIDEYIKIIDKLIKDGYAYQSGGNVYFDVSKLDHYYTLTNDKELKVGVREGVGEDSNKKNQADFALWFTNSKFENHELLWDSPYGRGYPGWHIECSGISLKYLGERLDIHGGGVDNIFPHHTNEIAQSEAFLGHKWCNYWFHNEHLLDSTGKMSKSNGAILTVSVLEEKGYDPLAFRFMSINSHYRKQLLFTYEALTQASEQLKKLRNKIELLTDNGDLIKDSYDKYRKLFIDEISNDLNTANGLTILYSLLKDNEVNDHTKLALVKDFDKVLGLDLIKEKSEAVQHDYIINKIEERKIAKLNKDYALADDIRNELLKLGVQLIDTKEGTTYKMV